jgi:hypothetical protein
MKVDQLALRSEEEQLVILNRIFWGHWRAPDRTPLGEWGQENVKLPHSARSPDFSLEISPWLQQPAMCITDSVTREMSVVGGVQGSKTTLVEVAIPYWLSNDPGPIMFNSDTDPHAHEWAEQRMIPALRASPATAEHMKKLGKNEVTKKLLKWSGSIFAIFQGAHAKGNLQQKSIRYLLNDEPWLYPVGHLTEAYKRVTSYWNSFILNTSTGGVKGGELHQRVEIAQQYVYQLRCPVCDKLFIPRLTQEKGKKHGGLRYDNKAVGKDGVIDFERLAKSVYYSCPAKGCHITDTPMNRRHMSQEGGYLMTVDAPTERKAFTFNGLVVDWVPMTTLVEEWVVALRALHYGDDTLLIEYVQKRMAEFWDPEGHRPVVKVVETTKGIEMGKGLAIRDMRAMTVDCQYGYFVPLIRDWHHIDGCQLVHFEKAETEEQLVTLQKQYEIDPRFVLVDAAHSQTKVLRLCAKFGWTALLGSDRKSFAHILEEDDDLPKRTIQRIYSPIQMIDPWVGTAEAGNIEVPLIYFSKFSAMERLFALRSGEAGYQWRVPEGVGDVYHRQLDSWEKRVRHNPRTNAPTEEFARTRKEDHVLSCELFQVVLASIMGVIGSERVEADQASAQK